jgi:branched-subunit amino acid transport protein
MTAWIVVLVAGAGTYLLRISLVALLAGLEPPAWLTRVAGYVVPAAFAGLAAVAVATPVGKDLRTAVPPLVAVAVTACVARVKPPGVAIGAGLPALWISTALCGAL